MFGWIKRNWRHVATLGLTAYLDRNKLKEQARQVNREMVEEIVLSVVLMDPQADHGQIQRHLYQSLRDKGIDPLGSATVRRALSLYLDESIGKARRKTAASRRR